jgi:hypothetical protein
MKDSEHEDVQAAAVPVSELTRRLLRRATEPIGVINVSHAAELHSRSSLWPGQRLELLDTLKSRYGLNLGAGGAAGLASPVAGGVSFIAPFDLASVSPSTGHAGTPETAMDTGSKGSSAPYYRVKRPDRHAAPDSPKPLSSETITAQSPAAGDIRVSSNSIPAKQVQPKTSETQSPVSSKPDPSAPPLVRAAAVDTPGHVDNKLAPRRDGSLTAGPLPQVRELPRIAIAAPMHLQHMPDGSAAEEIGRFSTPHRFRPTSTREDLPGDGAPKLSSPSPTRLPLQSKADHPPTFPVAVEEIGRSSTPHRFGLESTREDLPSDHAPALNTPSSTGLPLQRNADRPPTFPETNSVQTVETITALPRANKHSQSNGAVSAEIPATPSRAGSPSIVWRKADRNGASQESATPTLAVGPMSTSGPQIMREAASEPVSSSNMASVAIPALGSNGADVTRVAEQVIRIVARQLKVERERRGRTR